MGGRNCKEYDTFNYTSKLREPYREPGMRMVAKHARTPSPQKPPPSPLRAGPARGRRNGIVALKGLEERRGGRSTVPTRSRNANRKITVKEVRRNATHETDELTLAVQ